MLFLVMAFIPATESKQGQLLPPFVCLFLCGGAQRPERDISTLFCYCPPCSCVAVHRDQRKTSVPCSLTVHLISLREGVLLNLELCLWPVSSSDPLVSTFHSAGVTNIGVHGLMWLQLLPPKQINIHTFFHTYIHIYIHAHTYIVGA